MLTVWPLSARCTEEQKMNNTQLNDSIKCFRDTSVTAVVFPCLYSILFIAALILNSLAAWIFFSIPSTSTFLVFLKNVVRRQFLRSEFFRAVPGIKLDPFKNKTGGG